jgi:hypothetical protein
MKGIYITANDKVTDNTIALLNSIRIYDQETPIVLIPYDDNYHEIAQLLADKYQVKLYPDLDFIERLSQKLYGIFGSGFFARPNQFRKQACWFGEFEQFLYIDTDIVVFEKIADCLNYLSEYDFICCDYQYKAGISNVFSPEVIKQQIFTEAQLQDLFNCGFWGSKKNLISEEILDQTFSECAAHPEYFDFSQKTSDQPIINYMILTQIEKRLNLTKLSDNEPGSWAGSPHFTEKDYILYDGDRRLKYLHWAGIPMKRGGPYRELWEHYRHLGEEKPTHLKQGGESSSSLWTKLKNQARKLLKK